jgi:hydroxypyruvate isomerase
MPAKQSFCYPCFTNDAVNLDAICAAAASIGYPAVEWWFRDEQFVDHVAIAKSHGLIVASICGHQSLTQGLNHRDDHDRIEGELHASLDLAAEHGIANLICFSGNRRDGQTDADAAAACVAGLRRVASHAQDVGVTVNMELLNSKVDHPGYQCDRTAWGVAVCQQVDSPNIKLLYDIYHMQIMEGDVIRTIRDNIQWIGHFHTAGNPGRRDLDASQELNYAAICDAIHQTSYDGYLAHEFRPKGDPIAALRDAFDLCQN